MLRGSKITAPGLEIKHLISALPESEKLEEITC
jgi:hypothetical protein